MNDIPFLLHRPGYSRTLPRRSLDFQGRMAEIFGDRLAGVASEQARVLVLTRTDDPGADAVGLGLTARGVPYLRIDADALPGTARLALLEDSGAVEVSVGSRRRRSCDPRVVWLRHFDASAITPPKDDPVTRSYVRAEWELAVRALMSAPSVRWMNHPDAMHVLDRVSQLRLARRVGLPTPRTLVSNDSETIRSFVASCPTRVVVKVLGSHFVEIAPGTLHGIFPRIVDESDADVLAAAAVAPAIYQEYVPHIAEVRVTAIGEHMICAEVAQTGPAGVFEHPDDVLVRVHDLPAPIAEKLRRYMEHARLEYGAFDLLLTRDGRYFFLEVNPTGDWTWLEARNDALDITGRVCSRISGLLESTR